MRRVILLLFSGFIITNGFCQSSDDYIFFSGYILDKDSLPVVNAMIVNYRTQKQASTNEKGFFQVFVQKDDSFLVNHITYERRIIMANEQLAEENKYYLDYSSYEINPVSINYREMVNLKNNMDLIFTQLKESTPAYQKGTEYNRYAPPRKDQTFGLNIFELISWIQEQKDKKKNKK